MDSEDRKIRRQVWLGLVAALALWGLLKLALGSLPQDPAYHRFADTRTFLGVIPRAGDVLTNLAILGAAVLGWALRPRMALATNERAAANLLIAGTALTALGSAYYHQSPDNATLLWDRLPMTLVMLPAFVLVLADRVHPLFARHALWPFTVFAAASVVYWAWSETIGAGDMWLYAIARVVPALLIIALLVLREPRYTASAWLVAAAAGQVVLALFEYFDQEIFAATGGVASGHNLKHVTVGAALACLFIWLRVRRPRAPAPRAAEPLGKNVTSDK